MDLPNWDIIQSAAGYSTLTGILGGFALSAVAVVVSSTAGRLKRMSNGERSALETTLAWLISAFFSLLLVSFLYADLSGHDRYITSVDSATHQLIYGSKALQPLYLGLLTSILFASAAIQLVLGVEWLLAFLRLGSLPQRVARVVFFFLLPLVVLLVKAYYIVLEITGGQSPDVGSLSYWIDAVIVILAVVAAIVLFHAPSWLRSVLCNLTRRGKPSNQTHTGQNKRESDPSRNASKIAVFVALALTLGITVVYGFGENLPESWFSNLGTYLTGFRWVVFGILAALWSLYALSLPAISHSSVAAPASSGSDTEMHPPVQTPVQVVVP